MLTVLGRPLDIEYLYGHMPFAGVPPIPAPGLDRPEYVLVDEDATLAGHSHPQPIQQEGYFMTSVNLPCRHLALVVSTNVSASTALAVEKRLRASAGC
jgi:hypothetical protein